MSEKIVVPVLGESITEATVAKWLKNTGDAVEADARRRRGQPENLSHLPPVR